MSGSRRAPRWKKATRHERQFSPREFLPELPLKADRCPEKLATTKLCHYDHSNFNHSGIFPIRATGNSQGGNAFDTMQAFHERFVVLFQEFTESGFQFALTVLQFHFRATISGVQSSNPRCFISLVIVHTDSVIKIRPMSVSRAEVVKRDISDD